MSDTTTTYDPHRKPLIKKPTDAINPTPEVKETPIDIEKIQKMSEALVPKEHIPVKLCSNGLLGYPKILHYRDYTMEDILDLNVLDDDMQEQAIINVLNRLNFEKFDHNEMHPSDLMQVLIAIHGSFISPTIEKDYYLDVDLDEGMEEGQLDHPSNINSIDIPIGTLKLRLLGTDDKGNPITPQFKSPFTITDEDSGKKIKFRLTKIKDTIFASNYCKDKFFEEERRFSALKKDLNKLRTIKDLKIREERLDKIIQENYKIWTDYNNFERQKSYEEIKVASALQIAGIDDRIFTDDMIQEKLEAYKNEVGITAWKTANEVIEEYDFGIKPDVTFRSEKLQKEITRRFSFRYYNVLPTNIENTSRRYSVSFD